MIAPGCQHGHFKKFGQDRNGNQRFRCTFCGKTWTEKQEKLLGDMRIDENDAKLVLRLLTEGMSIRATERTTGMNRNTICKLIILFGSACQKYLDKSMKGLKLDHLQFDEQWTYVAKKQSRINIVERETCYDQGDIYIWTCIDQKTKLMPSFLLGKRSADNARRFMLDVAGRLEFLPANPSDDHKFLTGQYRHVTQVSTDGFAAYPEAVDHAFGPYVKYGVIIKEYKNANMSYTPSEMVGAKRINIRNIDGRNARSITTSHVERLNNTQRTFMKRLNRLTMCFSKKLENLEAAFAMFAAYYNYCWQTRMPGKSGKKRLTAAMMANIADHIWTFDELFTTVLKSATQS